MHHGMGYMIAVIPKDIRTDVPTQTLDLFKLVHFRPYPYHYSHLVVATKTRRQAGSTHPIRMPSCCNCIDFAYIKRAAW